MMKFDDDNSGEDAGIKEEIKKLVPEIPIHFLDASKEYRRF